MKGGKIIKNAVLLAVSLGVVILMLIYMGGGFREKIEPGTTDVPKRLSEGSNTDVVHRIVDVEKIEIVGTLRAERRVEVAPKVMATVKEVTVRAGDRVEKDTVLVRLDDRDQRAQLEQANQQVVAAEASLANAKSELDRSRNLLKENVISQQEFDRMDTLHKVADAELRRAREAVSSAETMLSYTVIESPISGIVVDKLVDVGDTATPGRKLMTVYDPSAFRLEAAVPEALSQSLKPGSPLTVKLDTLDQSIEGAVSEIVPMAEIASRSVLVKVDIPEDPKMVEGMFGRLIIPTRTRERYCVPLSAVRQVGQLRFVDVVKEDSSIERRQIKLGDHSEMGRVEVISGLDAGDRVVLYGPPPPSIPEDQREIMGGVVQ